MYGFSACLKMPFDSAIAKAAAAPATEGFGILSDIER